MPEGDTIHRAARTLHAALAGKELVRFEAGRVADPFPEVGTRIAGVEARGKHLIVRFGDGRMLHTHMRMTGSWHVYRPGERWRLHPSRARAVIEVPGLIAVCFDAPFVRLVDDDRALRGLGPDLTAPSPDFAEALRRMAAIDRFREIGEVLLDQRIASGIGNVYKSEVLWIERVDPFRAIGSVDATDRRKVLMTAARLLRSNLTTRRRVTVPQGLAVYRRAGLPCRRCGTTVERRLQGRDLPRSTYRCPSCQR